MKKKKHRNIWKIELAQTLQGLLGGNKSDFFLDYPDVIRVKGTGVSRFRSWTNLDETWRIALNNGPELNKGKLLNQFIDEVEKIHNKGLRKKKSIPHRNEKRHQRGKSKI